MWFFICMYGCQQIGVHMVLYAECLEHQESALCANFGSSATVSTQPNCQQLLLLAVQLFSQRTRLKGHNKYLSTTHTHTHTYTYMCAYSFSANTVGTHSRSRWRCQWCCRCSCHAWSAIRQWSAYSRAYIYHAHIDAEKPLVCVLLNACMLLVVFVVCAHIYIQLHLYLSILSSGNVTVGILYWSQ